MGSKLVLVAKHEARTQDNSARATPLYHWRPAALPCCRPLPPAGHGGGGKENRSPRGGYERLVKLLGGGEYRVKMDAFDPTLLQQMVGGRTCGWPQPQPFAALCLLLLASSYHRRPPPIPRGRHVAPRPACPHAGPEAGQR